MPYKSQPPTTGRQKARKRSNDLRILLVDPQDDLARFIRQAVGGQRRLRLIHSATAAEARTQIACEPADLIFVADRLSDGSGVELVRQLSQDHSNVQIVMVSDHANSNHANMDVVVAAIRAGACDLLALPLDQEQLSACIQRARSRHMRDQILTNRVDRLRRLCRKLNQARLDVAEQVDVLCNDLVVAYQELASQMQHVAASGEFRAMARNELDLEQLLRRSLEFIVEKSGPTNAAIFLPGTMDEFSLGGYVNYDGTTESTDIILEHFADVLVPKVIEHFDLVHATSAETVCRWIGDDVTFLSQSHLITFACRYEEDTLAVITLFRDCSEPFDPTFVETCDAVAPLLAASLARIIRVHHRYLPDSFETGGDVDVDRIPF